MKFYTCVQKNLVKLLFYILTQNINEKNIQTLYLLFLRHSGSLYNIYTKEKQKNEKIKSVKIWVG